MLKVMVLPHVAESLYTVLKTTDDDWIMDFVDLGGLSLLFDIVTLKHQKAKKTKADEFIEVEIFRCIGGLASCDVIFFLLDFRLILNLQNVF